MDGDNNHSGPLGRPVVEFAVVSNVDEQEMNSRQLAYAKKYIRIRISVVPRAVHYFSPHFQSVFKMARVQMEQFARIGPVVVRICQSGVFRRNCLAKRRIDH